MFEINTILGIPVAMAQVASSVGAAADQVGSQTSSQFANIVAAFLGAIPLWIAAIVIGIASYLVAIAVKKAIEAKMAAEGIEEEHKEIQIVAGRTAYFGVLVLGITISLSIVGLDLKPIVAAGAFGLGFALQDIIMNTISGVLILISRHFTIGDVINVSGVTGRIEEIQTRATIIKAFDGTKVIVPNAELFSNIVVSRTSNPFRKLSFIQGVGYTADLKQVMDLTLSVVKNIPGVLAKPKPKVIFTDWDDTYVLFKINVWIDSKGGKMVQVKNRVIMDIYNAYNEAGIDVPYPIQTIHMDKGDDEFNAQQVIDKKVAEIKKRVKDAKGEALVPNIIGFPLGQRDPVSADEISNPTPINIPTPVETAVAAPLDAQVETPVATPVVQTATTAPSAPLPTAIQATPNSPGQTWLQQALNQQVAQTQPTSQPVTSAAPIENVPVAVVTPPVEQVPVAVNTPTPVVETTPVATTVVTPSTPSDIPSWIPRDDQISPSPATGAPAPAGPTA